jgi:hypothetical protein
MSEAVTVVTLEEARAEGRAKVAMAVERDLRNRFGEVTPDEAYIIEITGVGIGLLALFDVDVRAFGADERAAAMHTSLCANMMRGMELLDTARTAGSVAEFVLSRALETQGALLMLRPAAGNA